MTERIEAPRGAIQPVVYPKFAEAYLGKELLELLRILDGVLEPYEALFHAELSPGQIALALQRNGIFEDLNIVADITALLRKRSKEKKAELIAQFGAENGERKFNEGIVQCLFPKNADARHLRKQFVLEARMVDFVDHFLDILVSLENKREPNPEQVIHDQLRANVPDDFRNTMNIPSHPKRQVALVSAWMRAYKNPAGKSPDEQDTPASKEEIEQWREGSRDALQKLQKYRLKDPVFTQAIDRFHLPAITYYPPSELMEFEIAAVSWPCPSPLGNWRHIALGISATTGHLGFVGTAAYTSLEPIFQHHGAGDYYEFLRWRILKALAIDVEANPAHFEQIILPEAIFGQTEVVQSQENEEDEDNETPVDSACDEAAEAIQKSINADMLPNSEKRESNGGKRHLRSIKPEQAKSALIHLGFKIFNGGEHTHIAGWLDGKMRTRNFNTHVSDDGFHVFLNEVLKFYKVPRRVFFDALR